MARPRQPIDLLRHKNKKNLTKKEIEDRQNAEVKAPADQVKAPSYLSTHSKKSLTKLPNNYLILTS